MSSKTGEMSSKKLDAIRRKKREPLLAFNYFIKFKHKTQNTKHKTQNTKHKTHLK